MSRKTKEQKKLAEYRRRLKLMRQASSDQNHNQIENLPVAELIDTKIQKKESQEDINSQIYFKKDLKKSLIFISLIITLEIIIYFARIKIY